ncbi:hypothetical protein F2P79_026125, partial [Pimephales promelas]
MGAQDSSWANQDQCFGAQCYPHRQWLPAMKQKKCLPDLQTGVTSDYHHGFGWDKYGSEEVFHLQAGLGRRSTLIPENYTHDE